MALRNGIDTLRGSVSHPGDPLYKHLTDLIEALEEADTSSTSKESTAQKIPVVVTRVSGLSRSDQEMVGADPCPNRRHSDSSADDIIHHKSYATEATVDPGSDTDGEVNQSTLTRQKQRPSSIGLLGFKGSNTTAVPIKICRSLRLPATGFPAESDSFPETFTPRGYKGQRRKRLVKKMAVDGSPGDGTTGYLVSSNNMDVQLNKEQRRSSVISKRRRPSEQSYGSSMECDCDDSSSVSSSDSDQYVSSDNGRQADDEQSDWPWEPPTNRCWSRGSAEGECMGVPTIRPTLFAKRQTSRQDLELGLGCSLDPDPGQTPNTIMQESSDTDMSMSSCSKTNQRIMSRRWLSKPGIPTGAAINRKLVQFLQNPNQQQYKVSQLRKSEKQQMLEPNSNENEIVWF